MQMLTTMPARQGRQRRAAAAAAAAPAPGRATPRRASAPARPRGPRDRRRRAQGRAQAVLLAPRRCPHCYADQVHLAPVPETAVQVAEIVARRTLEGRDTTSAEVAPLLSTPSRAITAEQVSTRLKRACQDGLLARWRTSLPAGGYAYVYRAKRLVLAYVSDGALAAQLAAHFGC